MTTQTKDNRTSRQIVLDAIQALSELGQFITRGNLQEATGLTLHIVDDHVSRMVDEDGTLRRVRPGVYELVKGVGRMPNVYFTDIGDDGSIIIEIEDKGKLTIDDVRVARKIAERLYGSYAQLATLELQKQFDLVSQSNSLELKAAKRELSQRLAALEAENQALKLKVAEVPVQGALLLN